MEIDSSNGFTERLVEDSTDYGEDIDDYEKELQQLNDGKTEAEENISPPPTLDESMSDQESSPLPIAATVTLKTLESPRSVIFTSPSRPASGISAKIPDSSSDFVSNPETLMNEVSIYFSFPVVLEYVKQLWNKV